MDPEEKLTEAQKRGFEPTRAMIVEGRRAYNHYQSNWYQFAQRWNKEVAQGKTNPNNVNGFSMDEAYALLYEAQSFREFGNAIHKRYHGVGNYLADRQQMEVPYSTISAAEQVGSIKTTLQMYIRDKTIAEQGEVAINKAQLNDVV